MTSDMSSVLLHAKTAGAKSRSKLDLPSFQGWLHGGRVQRGEGSYGILGIRSHTSGESCPATWYVAVADAACIAKGTEGI